jgi:two-component system, chemotaxis family, CheB/CheR fusion protein
MTANSVSDVQQGNSPQAGKDSVTIVGLGASAGGLAALRAFFEALPPDTGMAFVIVTHMAPDKESLLPEILARHTPMPVHQVQSLVPVEANQVYVIPPGLRIVMTDTHLDTQDFEKPHGHRMPIDTFFRSVAAVHHRAIAIILSGGGSDGAVGVKAIKEVDGLLFVQDPDEAEYDSMPRATIATGLADLVLPVRELAEKLVYLANNKPKTTADVETLNLHELEVIQEILNEVRLQIGHDFSQYKRGTLFRRIQRRMQLTGQFTLDSYLAYLNQNPEESRLLFNDLLIGVTHFFRDKKAWQALSEQVIPRLFADKGDGERVRVWSIGCATGEEAYSLAILLLEQALSSDNQLSAVPVQIFASDLDEEALDRARAGVYPEAIEADVSEARLHRFFIKEGHFYRLRREVRDIVLFTAHSVLRDPPFSRLDLISCRNLLIYLQRTTQRDVFEIFHYALNPHGYLFVGSAESVEMLPDMFHMVDSTHRLYQAQPRRSKYPRLPTLPLTVNYRLADLRDVRRLPQEQSREERGGFVEIHQQALEEYAPPSVLVDGDYRILHISETAGRYLLHPSGEITNDLLRVARPELHAELRATLFEALVSHRAVVSAPVYVRFNGRPHRLTLSVRPRPAGEPGAENPQWHALIFFLEDESDVTTAEKEPTESPAPLLVEQLQSEVRLLRERLQKTVERYEASNEELKAANEELQSVNEEYRSTLEELETSKEELQSINEELQSVNNEFKEKLDELSRTHNDLENLIAATEIATLFLDRDLRILWYTPGIKTLFNIMGGDSGRPIAHLTSHLRYEQLVEDARQVLRTFKPIEREVRSEEGEWYLVQVRPYRQGMDEVTGVILTFVDTTAIKKTEKALAETRERYGLLVETTSEYAIFTMNKEGLIDTWNLGARRILQYKEEEILGRSGSIIFTPEDLAEGAMEHEMRLARETGQAVNERWHLRRDGSRFWGSGVTVSLWEGNDLRGYAKVMRDNTARKAIEATIRERERELARLNETLEEQVRQRTQALEQRTREVQALAAQLTLAEHEERHRLSQVLHDDLQQRLYAVQMQHSLLEAALQAGDFAQAARELAEINEWLRDAISMTRHLSVNLSPPVLHDEGLVEAVSWLVSQMDKRYGLQVALQVDDALPVPQIELRVLLFQIVRELLFNIVKHAGILQARVALGRVDGRIRIVVSDEGQGFNVDAVMTARDSHGLIHIRQRLHLFGGEIAIRSEVGVGTTVTVLAPVMRED